MVPLRTWPFSAQHLSLAGSPIYHPRVRGEGNPGCRISSGSLQDRCRLQAPLACDTLPASAPTYRVTRSSAQLAAPRCLRSHKCLSGHPWSLRHSPARGSPRDFESPPTTTLGLRPGDGAPSPGHGESERWRGGTNPPQLLMRARRTGLRLRRQQAPRLLTLSQQAR